MINKSLIKLIDEAIIPAILLIIAKMLGILAATYFLNLSFTVEPFKVFFVLPAVVFKTAQDYQIAENYSNLAVYATAAIGTLAVLIRAHFFHSSHIKPSFHAKLENLNLAGLVMPTYHLYHQAAIWLIYMWLAAAFLIISAFIKVTNPIVAVVAFIVSANFTWIFLSDLEYEIKISKDSE